ncbi:MAG: exosome complex RNA-binding protein Rrp4 [Candidatus Aenigmatarchaeota archaeon]
MSEIKIEDKAGVLPGDELATGSEYLAGRGCFKENDTVKSKFLGTARIKNKKFNVVPLAGVYIPEKGDKVIGRITGVQVSSWWVEINSPYDGFLPLSEGTEEFVDLDKTELSEIYDVGDIVYAEVIRVTKDKDVKLSMDSRMCKELNGGTIVRIRPSRVPRLIGKGGSMVKMIKDKTDTQIIIGQNGVVWVNGDKIELAEKAIKMVDKNGHMEGLTDKVREMLESESE